MDISRKGWWVIGVIVVVVILIGLSWLVSVRRAGESQEMAKEAQLSATTSAPALEGASEQTDETASGNTVQLAGETVTVSDQKAGASVAVDSVSVVKPTWIAIKDTNGWVLGAELINQSEDNASVTLIRNTKPGETYQAVMYVDDGDQWFDLHKDALVTDDSDAPVASTFKAQ